MFIREKKKSKKNVSYVQYQLIRSVRTPAGPRQELVLNMGQQLDLPKEKWKILANAIEEKLLKKNSLFLYDSEIDTLAKYYTLLIEKNSLNKQALENKEGAQEKASSDSKTPDYATIDLNTVQLADARSYGGEYLVNSIMCTYDLENLLWGLGFTKSQIQYSKMLIGARMLHPSSERETARWLNENSTFPEFVGKTDKVSDNGLHRAATLLWKNHESIEKKLADTSKTLFSLEEKVILYDLTNTYFESSKQSSTIAQYHKSKEKRNDCPLITLALTVDEEGFPKQSKIYKGNIGEASTLEDFLKELKKSSPKRTQTLVLDAGIATEENLSLIRSKPYNFHYIAVSRKRSYPDDFWVNRESEELFLSDNKTILTLTAERIDNEIFLQCHSQAKALKEQAMYVSRMGKFEKALQQLHEGLTKKGYTKKYDKVLEKIGRLKQQYRVGKYYTIEIEKKGVDAVAILFSRNEKAIAHEDDIGNYVLRTSRFDLNNREISQVHRALTTVKDSFRSMKSHLGLRPIYHQEDYNSEAHIHVTVLAYQFVIAILKKLRTENNIFYNWDTIRETLKSHQRVSTTMAVEDESVIRLRQNTLPSEKQQTLFQAMGKIMGKGLKRVKQIFNKKSSAENKIKK